MVSNPSVVLFRKLIAWIQNPAYYCKGALDHECPVCGYKGRYLPLGSNPRRNGRCPGCGSRERHRLLYLCMQANKINLHGDGQVLHFSPEKYILNLMQGNENYHTADIVPGNARHTMDMTEITFPDACFDLLISNHVLEHIINDHLAVKECFRVLKPGGIALFTVPIDWTRQHTYENLELKTKQQRLSHYGDANHVRLYGRDFKERLSQIGFHVQCWRLPEDSWEKYGLLPDDVIWLATKP